MKDKKSKINVPTGSGKSYKRGEGIYAVGQTGKGKNHLKIKLKEMFGIEATDEQTEELEKFVFKSKGFTIITEEDIKNSKSYRISLENTLNKDF